MTKLLAIALLCWSFAACKSTTSSSTKPNNNTVQNTHKGEQEFQAYLDRKRNGFIGKRIPSLDITGIDGQTYNPAKMKGKIILLNFWFAACKPCITEIASLNELQRKFKNNNLVVLSVSTDAANVAQAWAERKKMEYTVAAYGKVVAERLQVVTFPTSFLIDEQGVIQDVFIGSSADDATHTYSEVKPQIERLLR